jgi:apolipoprotein N-acyltransferase
MAAVSDRDVPFARLLTVAVGGVLVAISMPPWGFWPLAFVGVIAFEVGLDDDLSRRRRALFGGAFALPWMLIALAWMWFLTAPGYVVVAALFAGLHAAAAAIAPSGPWRTIGRPVAHTLAEVIRMLVPFGGVPLATLGISQAGGPFLGVARVGGVILLTWVVFQIGFALAAAAPAIPAIAARRRSTPIARPQGLFALAGVVVVVVLAAIAPEGSDRDVAPITIAAVQGGGRQGTSALDVPSSSVTRAHLEATSTIEPSDDLDLVIWPENGIDVDDRPFTESPEFGAIAVQAARLGVPIAVGITIDSEYSAHPVDDSFVNAQVVVSPEADVVSVYEKVRIVPFGEYVPLRGALEALGAPLDQIPSDATRGRDPAVITTPDGTRLGVLVSWEVFFGDRGRAAADSDVLINPTNGASYTGTILQTQQIASSRLRAAETGRWLVQVSPTGFSAFVSPDGDVFQRTDVSEQRVITMEVPLREGTTWYTAAGDWPWILLVSALLALAWWCASRTATSNAAAGSGVRPRAAT